MDDGPVLDLDAIRLHLQYLRSNHDHLTDDSARQLLMEVYKLELILLQYVQRNEGTDENVCLSPLTPFRLS